MEFDISKITSFEDIRKVYYQIKKEEDVLNEEINQFYLKKDKLAESVLQLESSRPNFELLDSNSNTLSKMIMFAAELADSVSVKVRQLDLAKNRVQQCILRVEDILDLKACTEGAQKALEEENYESAAAHIKRYMNMDENMLRLTIEEEAENSLKILHKSEQVLKAIASDKFDQAVRDNDFPAIERFFKIFPLLSQSELGLTKFGTFITNKINIEMSGQLKLADVSDPNRHTVKFVDLMTTLLETVAQMLKDYQGRIENHYGYGHLLILLNIVQNECDTWSVTILDKFKSERKLSSKISRVKSVISNSSHSHQVSANVDKPEPMELEALISEIVLINTRVELYLRFLRRRLNNDFESANDDKKNAADYSELCTKFFSRCRLVNEMQELINYYILLEEYFLMEMIEKAININETEDKTQVSKIVDGVFFVVNKCIRRTLSSGNVEGVCAMLNLASMFLTEQYATNTLEARIKQSPLSSGAAWMREAYNYMQSGSIGLSTVASSNQLNAMAASTTNTGSSRQHAFIIHLNSTEISIECMQTLKVGLEKEIEALFQKSEKASLIKLHECLTAMTSSVTDKLREISENALNELMKSVIKPQIKNSLQNLSTMKHILTEDELLSLEANDPWVENFILNIQNILSHFQEIMVPVLFERLIQKLCVEVVYRIEKTVKEKSFNRLGGIQFDREIRAVINFLATTTKWGVRDKFTRIRQIASILNMENPGEISSYWDSMSWRLTPNEVRKFLVLRSDFRSEDIRKLKFT